MNKNAGLSWLISGLVFAFVLGIVFLCLWSFSIVFIVLGIILMLLSFVNSMILIGVYNKIVRHKNKINESLALIDIQLKLRFDLIPNLVETVKGYAKHEEKVLTEVIELRNQAINATNEEEKIEDANNILPKLKQTVLLAEDYPKLKADSLFLSLMQDLVDIEDRIVAARRIYDSNVTLYNSLIQIFPNNLISHVAGFKTAELIRIDTAEKILPNINFDGGKE